MTYSGKVSLANLQDKKIKINVTKIIVGAPVDAGSGGVIRKTKNTDKGVNGTATITWELELLPGAHKEIMYGYTSYMN